MIMKWDELSMKDKAAIIKIAVNNGYTKINDIKNKYEEGGSLEEQLRE